MKRFVILMLIATALAACTESNIEEVQYCVKQGTPDHIDISFDDENTRVQLNASGKTVWTEGDYVSAFYMTDANNKFRFNGKTGDRTGRFMVESQGDMTAYIDKVVLLYPYSSTYKLNPATKSVNIKLPTTQYYMEGSYGVGANLMASVESGDNFTLKSLCGWIVVQLKGDATVTSITLSGNNGEQLAGDAKFDYDAFKLDLIYYPEDPDNPGDSSVGGSLIWGDYQESITLVCDEGIKLNPNTPTEFYFVVPPQTFAKGITIEAECLRGEPIIKKSSKALIVKRNHIIPMATITANEVIPNNQIWYTSSDGDIVEPYDDTAFGATLLSNTCVDGIGVMTFDAPITEIGNWAFYECLNLTSIFISNNVTTIGGSSFSGCSSLNNVPLPNSVTTIEGWAFHDCDNLTKVTIPNSVTTIGNSVFENCDRLTEFSGKFAADNGRCLIKNDTIIAYANASGSKYIIPNSVTTIGNRAFWDCDNLKNVTIPNSVKKIGNEAFFDCNGLTNVTIGDGVITIGNSVFSGCSSLTSVTIPNNVTTIGESIFFGCSSLNNVTLPNSITTIEGWAFHDCDNLTKVTIPNSVTTIEGWAFYDCENLTSVTIPNSVTEIGNNAFSYCKNLKEVFCKATTPPSIPIGVFGNNASGRKIYVPYESYTAYITADGWSEYKDSIVGYDFEKGEVVSPNNQIWYTSSNDSIIYPYTTDVFGANIVSNTYSNGMGVITFDGVITSIGEMAFWNCYFLTSIAIPNSVTEIGNNAFSYCKNLEHFYGKFASADGRCLIIDGTLNSFAPYGLTEYIIPDSVTSIGESAFYWCNHLTSITIGNGVKKIGKSAFYCCRSLTSVSIPNSVTSIGDSAFYDCDNLTSATIGNSVTSIGESAFYWCNHLTSITIGNSVKKIGKFAFDGCGSLTSVTIPDSVTEIESNAFGNCFNLTSITIPDSVILIGSDAFCGCISLSCATIGNSVTSIGESAFFDCDSLKEFKGKFASADGRCLIIDGTLNSFAPYGLTEYIIPDSVTSIGEDTFWDCDSLTSVTIPNSVTKIGLNAFYDCTNLTSITIPNSVTEIGWSAFSGCENLKEVYCKATTPPDVLYGIRGSWGAFDDNASGRKIYVPRESVEAYKSAGGWKEYASAIVGYDF